MKAIFDEGDETILISILKKKRKNITCIRNDNNDMMKVQITRKEDSSEIRNSKKLLFWNDIKPLNLKSLIKYYLLQLIWRKWNIQWIEDELHNIIIKKNRSKWN